MQALESRGIAHLLVGGKAFHEREEVDALRTALVAIERPDDALSVFATLRGPFFAIGEEDMLAWHALGHGFRPYDVPDEVPEGLGAARRRAPHACAICIASAITVRSPRPSAGCSS